MKLVGLSRDRLKVWLLVALILLPLAMFPILGLLTPYVTVVLAVGLFVATIVARRFKAAYASYPARAFALVVLLFAILFAITATKGSDILRALNFTMLLTYGAIEYFFMKSARSGSAWTVVKVAGLGVAVGLIEVVLSATLGQSSRPSAINIGPIVLSNGLLAIGFLCLGGALVRRDRLAWLCLLAPIAAVLVAVVSGSRGPLIAVPFAALSAAIFFWRYRFGGTLRSAAIMLGAIVVAIGGGALALPGRVGSLLKIIGAAAQGGTLSDETANIRLVLYRAGWQSFQQSPWIGHGWANIMASIKPFLTPDQLQYDSLPQLHNDVLNFAVAAGVFGVAAYLVILTAPVVGALLSPRDSLRPFRLYATTTIMIVYAGGGLTDLMFGFEFHTFLYAMLTAIVLGYCRDPIAAAPATTIPRD